MLNKEILTEIKNFFPSSEIILLQENNSLENSDHHTLSVFDINLSSITTLKFKLQNFNFYLLLVPLGDLDGILFSEWHNPTSTFLETITSSDILYEKTELGSLIKIKASKMLGRTNGQETKASAEYLKRLHFIRSRFDKKLRRTTTFFLVHESLELISSLELLKSGTPTGSGKLEALSIRSPRLVRKLVNLASTTLTQKGPAPLLKMTLFIDEYLSQLISTSHSKDVISSRIILDISYEEINFADFQTNIWSEITQDTFLKERRVYYYRSSSYYKAIYRNHISIIFLILDEGDESKIRTTLKKTLSINCGKKSVYISSLPSSFYEYDHRLARFWTKFEPVGISVNEMHGKQLQTGSCENERNLFIFLICMSFVAKTLDLTLNDIRKTNLLISKRFQLSLEEQQQHPFQLASIVNSKLHVSNLFVESNKTHILNALKVGLNFKSEAVATHQGKEYDLVLCTLNSFIIDDNWEQDETDVNLFVLKNNFQTDEPVKCSKYLQTFDRLAACFNLLPTELHLVSNCLLEGFAELSSDIEP